MNLILHLLDDISGLILGLCPANERRHNFSLKSALYLDSTRNWVLMQTKQQDICFLQSPDGISSVSHYCGYSLSHQSYLYIF